MHRLTVTAEEKQRRAAMRRPTDSPVRGRKLPRRHVPPPRNSLTRRVLARLLYLSAPGARLTSPHLSCHYHSSATFLPSIPQNSIDREWGGRHESTRDRPRNPGRLECTERFGLWVSWARKVRPFGICTALRGRGFWAPWLYGGLNFAK